MAVERPGRLWVIGIGPGGLDQLTIEAVEALRSVSAYLVVSKRDGDPLVAAREAIIARHVPEPPPVVTVQDPERDRGKHDAVSYVKAVADWHAARVSAYRAAVDSVDGDIGVLVWGDPAFYDSTVRIVAELDKEVRVVPGVSSISLLAARFGMCLHEIGQPVHVTTGRRLAEAAEQGQRNIVAMLLSGTEALESFAGWHIWWAANLGTPHERLVSGPVAEVLGDIARARTEVRQASGWVMDTCRLLYVEQ